MTMETNAKIEILSQRIRALTKDKEELSREVSILSESILEERKIREDLEHSLQMTVSHLASTSLNKISIKPDPFTEFLQKHYNSQKNYSEIIDEIGIATVWSDLNSLDGGAKFKIPLAITAAEKNDVIVLGLLGLEGADFTGNYIPHNSIFVDGSTGAEYIPDHVEDEPVCVFDTLFETAASYSSQNSLEVLYSLLDSKKYQGKYSKYEALDIIYNNCEFDGEDAYNFFYEIEGNVLSNVFAVLKEGDLKNGGNLYDQVLNSLFKTASLNGDSQYLESLYEYVWDDQESFSKYDGLKIIIKNFPSDNGGLYSFFNSLSTAMFEDIEFTLRAGDKLYGKKYYDKMLEKMLNSYDNDTIIVSKEFEDSCCFDLSFKDEHSSDTESGIDSMCSSPRGSISCKEGLKSLIGSAPEGADEWL